MTTFFLLFLFIASVSSKWIPGPTPMPVTNYAMAVGYYKDKIYLVGGSGNGIDYNGKALMVFDPSSQTFTDYNANALPIDLRAFSNWYTQKGNLLFMSGDYDGYIHIFDLSNGQFTSQWAKAPINGQRFSCVAGDDNYLYYLGSGDASTFTNNVQILTLNDLANPTWEIGPSMQQARGYFACSISPNNRVYAIGGVTDSNFNALDTIEYISTTNIENNKWILLNDRLTSTAQQLDAVLDNYNIFAVGGDSGSPSYVYSDMVHIINTLTNSVTLMEDRLLAAMFDPVPAVYDGVLYVFGGKLPQDIDTWQYKIIPTHAPTKSPTIQPTNDPTVDPTMQPTDGPTNDPSENPTSQPTMIPSANPTQYPSEHPTFQPTRLPSIDPTENPTADPSEVPTIMPTNNPTQYPSLKPTTASPTNPSMVTCGQGSSGAYNGGILEIEIKTSYESTIGDIVIDASLSTFTITALRGFDGQILKGSDGGSGDWDEIKDDVLTLHNMDAGIYKIQIEGISKGTYVLTTECIASDSAENSVPDSTSTTSTTSSTNTNVPKEQQDGFTLNTTTQHLLIIGVIVVLALSIIGCTVCFIIRSKQKKEHTKMEMVESTSPRSENETTEKTNKFKEMDKNNGIDLMDKDDRTDLMQNNNENEIAVNIPALPAEGNETNENNGLYNRNDKTTNRNVDMTDGQKEISSSDDMY